MAGLVYAGLGISALKHIAHASQAEQLMGWTLWWWLESARYDKYGQRLCHVGAWVFAIGAACWLLAFYCWGRS